MAQAATVSVHWLATSVTNHAASTMFIAPMRASWLVGWCLTAISAQIAYIMPWMFQIYRLGLEQTRSKETHDKIGPREIHVPRSCITPRRPEMHTSA